MDPTLLRRRLARALPRPVHGALRALWRLPHLRVVHGPLTYDQDGLATRHSAEFMAGERFRRAYALGRATGSWGVHDVQWRVHVCCWAATVAARLPGDFVECGVYRGGTARAVLEYLDLPRLGKRLWLVDTFRGLPAEQVTPDERRQGIHPGMYEDCWEDVQRTFAPFPCVRLVRGAVPAVLPQVAAERVAWLSLDMNSAAPTLAALEALWPRLAPGAPVVLDDYGWLLHAAQKRAIDAFAARAGVEVLSLPTGQGLLLKPGPQDEARRA